MPNGPKAVAFGADPDSLANLGQALPAWEIQTIHGACPGSLTRDWDPGAADLLIIGAREQLAQTLGLCRGLRSQAGRAHTPFLVLVWPAQESVVRAAPDAGADSCLLVPVHPKELASMLARASHARSRPGPARGPVAGRGGRGVAAGRPA